MTLFDYITLAIIAWGFLSTLALIFIVVCSLARDRHRERVDGAEHREAAYRLYPTGSRRVVGCPRGRV